MDQINLIIYTIISTIFITSFFFVLPFLKHASVRIFFIFITCIYFFQSSIILTDLDLIPKILKYIFLTGRFSIMIVVWILACHLFQTNFQIKFYHILFLLLKVLTGFVLYWEEPTLLQLPNQSNFSHFIKFTIYYTSTLFIWILILNEIRKGAKSEFIQKKKGFVLKIFQFIVYSWVLFLICLGIFYFLNFKGIHFSIFVGLLSILWYIVLFNISYRGLLELTATSKDINQLRDANNELSTQIIEYINSTQIFKDPDLTLKKFAKNFSIKPEDLRHIILYEIKGFKFTDFREFINHFRIKEATRLLNDKSNNFNILNLAYEVGFNSPATFYRAFQKEIGISPKEYLKKYQ